MPADPRDVRHHLEPIDAVNDQLELPPQARTTRTADFVAPFPMSVAMVSTHQHRYGTYASVIDGIDSAVVYENRRWSEPPLRWLDPAVRLGTGDRLRVQCEWHNRSDVTVRYGSSATDEMCTLNGYFFRDVEVAPEARTMGVLVPVVE